MKNSKRKRIGEQKNSKPTNRPAATEKAVKKAKVIITPETTLRVTYRERGRFLGCYVKQGQGKDAVLVPMYDTVSTVVTMQPEAVQFFISDEGRPRRIKEGEWRMMGKEARIRANIDRNADGRHYDILFVN